MRVVQDMQYVSYTELLVLDNLCFNLALDVGNDRYIVLGKTSNKKKHEMNIDQQARMLKMVGYSLPEQLFGSF